ncbi:MAG TPA: hypothetical protein VNK52_14025 [Hyphomicrobiaceae bacterium]|nr:hypothetical protein [Hyphomicrobiaceae bacterium]
MQAILASPGRTLVLAGAVSLAILIGWLAAEGADGIGLLSFLLRFAHVMGAVIWLGMIWFVNFIQLDALAMADKHGRGVLMKSIVPRVANTFRHASHLTVASGLMLLFTSGYLLGSLVYATEVHTPPLRNALLWSGVLGGGAMWVIVNMMIWPSLKIILGHTADAGAKAAARARVAMLARINLALSVPVTFVMVAAAHLY